MKPFVPYLRVVAGFVAAVCLWLVVVELVNGRFDQVLVQLLFAAGLGYLAVGTPIREYVARVKAENDGLAARAQAGHEAFLAGDPAAFAPPPVAPPRRPVRRGVIVAVVVAAVFVVIGIVTDLSDGLDTESSGAATTEPTTTQPSITQPTAAAQPTEARAAVAAPASAAPVRVPMPNVRCLNLQVAQDTIQAAGVFYSRSVDATGQGRSQLVDSNWVVVAQTPAAGEPIGEGDAVLSAVKIGEPGDCS